ncbi:hypothetical protein MBLNU459_g5714t1 [Dothideomycetes sp. NU459]
MASFGVGDFMIIVNLAYTVYDRCKSSTSAYRDIARDVGNAHIVLRAIQRFWEEQNLRGRELTQAQKDELKEVGDRCKDGLERLDKVYQRYKDFDRDKSLVDRLKFAWKDFTHDFASIRVRLQEATSALAILNAQLTASAAAQVNEEQLQLLKNQSNILQILVVRNQEFQDGKREEPAFSQVAGQLQGPDQSKAFANIGEELAEENVDEAIFENNLPFIQGWIETVISCGDSDCEKSNHDGSDTDPEVSTLHHVDAVATTVPKVEDLVLNSSIEDWNTEIAFDKPGEGASEACGIQTPKRYDSCSSHRSQNSRWKDPVSASSSYGAVMLDKVFRSHYHVDRGDTQYHLLIKRAFHAEDWIYQGWLSLEQVSKLCHEAASRVVWPISQSSISKLVVEEDRKNKKPDHRINRDEFVNIIMAMRRHYIKHIVDSATTLGFKHAEILLDRKQYLPPGWTSLQIDEGSYEYYHPLLCQRALKRPLKMDLGSAVYLATDHCERKIVQTLRTWREDLQALPPDVAEEYKQALRMALEVASSFHGLEDPAANGNHHPLDSFVEEANMIPKLKLDVVTESGFAKP